MSRCDCDRCPVWAALALEREREARALTRKALVKAVIELEAVSKEWIREVDRVSEAHRRLRELGMSWTDIAALHRRA